MMTETSEFNFEQCIKCTVCTVYCPVAAVNPLYPGPKQAGPDGERLRLKRPEFFDESLKWCLNCKRCEVACPSNVRIGDIIQAARIKHSKKKPGLREYMLANTDFMGTMASPLAPVVNMAVGLKPVKYVMDKTIGIDHRRMFPKYAFGTFESWLKRRSKKQAKFARQVSYFHGCYVNYNNPQLGKDFVKIMNALGVGVQLLEKEKCCGVALISNGLIDQAKRQGEVNISSIRRSVVDNKIPVVGTSSTCTFTLRDEYPTCSVSRMVMCAIASSSQHAISIVCFRRAMLSCVSRRMRLSCVWHTIQLAIWRSWVGRTIRLSCCV